MLHLSDRLRLTVSGYQYVGLQNLIQRNEQLFNSENAPSGGVSLPFILVQVDFLPFSFKGIIIFDIMNDLSFLLNLVMSNFILFFERNKVWCFFDWTSDNQLSEFQIPKSLFYIFCTINASEACALLYHVFDPCLCFPRWKELWCLYLLRISIRLLSSWVDEHLLAPLLSFIHMLHHGSI